VSKCVSALYRTNKNHSMRDEYDVIVVGSFTGDGLKHSQQHAACDTGTESEKELSCVTEL